jgi:hypothetical protein
MALGNDNVTSCNSCGTTNRVAAYSFKQLPRCGKCRTVLSEPLSTKTIRRLYQHRYLLIVLSSLAWLAVWPPRIAWPDLSGTAVSATPWAKVSDGTCADRLQPNEEIYASYTNLPNQVSLTIKTAGGSNYFVKLNDAASGRRLLSFYLYGGSIFETRVPRGNLLLKYATGTAWCGEHELFGSSTETEQADRVFEFNDTYKYTIELIARTNGNLPKRRISRDDFNRDH